MDFKIVPVPSYEKPDPAKLDPHLFPCPSRVVLIGQTNSGKSSWMYSALKHWYPNGYWDLIRIYSPTMRFDEAWSEIPNVELHVDFDQSELQNFCDEVESIQAQLKKLKRRRYRVLVIFDDMITKGVSRSGSMNVIDEIFIKGRHSNISVWITSQYYKSLNQNMRNANLSQLVLFRVNTTELGKICEEQSGGFLSPDQLEKIIQDAFKTPYGYIVIDLAAKPNHRIRIGMSDVLELK